MPKSYYQEFPLHLLMHESRCFRERDFDAATWSDRVIDLIQKGVSPVEKDGEGLPPFGYFVFEESFNSDEQRTCVQRALVQMISHGANPLVPIAKLNASILCHHLNLSSAATNHLDMALLLLSSVNECERQGFPVLDEEGNTALASIFSLANNANDKVGTAGIKWVLSNWCSISSNDIPLAWLESKNKSNQTLLHAMYAWRQNRPRLAENFLASFYSAVELLIKKGKECLNAQDVNGRYAFEHIVSSSLLETPGHFFKLDQIAAQKRDAVLAQAYDAAAAMLTPSIAPSVAPLAPTPRL